MAYICIVYDADREIVCEAESGTRDRAYELARSYVMRDFGGEYIDELDFVTLDAVLEYDDYFGDEDR